MAGAPARLADLGRAAGQSTVLADLEHRRLQRIQAARQACVNARDEWNARNICATDAVAAHASRRERILRAAYDGIAGQHIGVDALHAVRAEETRLQSMHEAIMAEAATARDGMHAAEAALAEADAALAQAVRRSRKRERLAGHLVTQHRRALDDADEAARAEETAGHAAAGPAAWA